MKINGSAKTAQCVRVSWERRAEYETVRAVRRAGEAHRKGRVAALIALKAGGESDAQHLLHLLRGRRRLLFTNRSHRSNARQVGGALSTQQRSEGIHSVIIHRYGRSFDARKQQP
jgi:hypothetical protein